MAHYLLRYTLARDYLERRPQWRERHLALAWAASERGDLLLGGALDPLDGAVLLFEGEGPDVAERFAEADPYVREGLVERWTVHRWVTVAGERADSPVRP